MVSVKYIESVFDKIINNVKVKCPTIAEMRSRLKGMSFDDQYNQLKEKNLLNPLEVDDFMYQVQRLEHYKNTLSEVESQYDPNEEDTFGLKNYMERLQENIDDAENELFQYGRRLIEGYEWDLPPVEFNRDDYVSEEYDVGGIVNTIGKIESKQISAQQETVHVDPTDLSPINIGTDENPKWVNGKLNDDRLVAMNNYFNGDCEGLNYWIGHKRYLNELNTEQRKSIKDIDSLMDESPGLQQDTVLYRGGHFNIHTRVGDTVSFKGYQSTSFSRATAESYNEEKSDGMTYVIHAPKGTKGIVGNDYRFENGDWEHEYVLPRNTKMKVVNIDYDNMVCEVVIEGE